MPPKKGLFGPYFDKCLSWYHTVLQTIYSELACKALFIYANILILQLSVRACVRKVSLEAIIMTPVKINHFICTLELRRYRSSQSKQLAMVLSNYWSHPLWKYRRPKLDRHVRLALPGVKRLRDGEREVFGSHGCPWMLYGSIVSTCSW